MPVKQLPRFVIYQPNMKEFHICFEAKGKFIRWCSNHAPTLDVRFAREVKRIEDVPVEKLQKKSIFDEGTYMVTKSDTKESAEQKLMAGIDNKTFAFILNGKKLKGRFSLKHVVGGTVLQKYKDQYAIEEDVLLDDLSRTINIMIPDYDEKKVKIPSKEKIKQVQLKQPKPVVEKLTADKNIEDVDYHFIFYTSNKKPDICLVTDESGASLVLRHEKNGWVLLQPINRTSSKTQEALIQHAGALYKLKRNNIGRRYTGAR